MFKVGDRVRFAGNPDWYGIISELMWVAHSATAAVNWYSVDGSKRDFDFNYLIELELLPDGNDILKGIL